MKQNVKDKRNYVIIGLIILVLFMAVGFAAFSTNLQINGTANISSNWCLGFDNTKTDTYTVTKGLSTGTTPTGTMTYSGTACSTNYVPTVTLDSDFYQPGDKIVYTLTIANKSSLTAAIESITVDGVSKTSNYSVTKGNIIYTVEMPGTTTLASNGTTTMKVTAEFQNTSDISNYTSGERQTITVGINAVQDDGNGGFTPISASQTVYAINTSSIYKDTSTLQDIGQTYGSCIATGRNTCLKYTIEDNTVTGAEVCFIKGGSEYCLKGWVDECRWDDDADNGNGACTYGTPSVYNANVEVLQANFTETNDCSYDGSESLCYSSDFFARADLYGYVAAGNDSWNCNVYSDDYARCYVGE